MDSKGQNFGIPPSAIPGCSFIPTNPGTKTYYISSRRANAQQPEDEKSGAAAGEDCPCSEKMCQGYSVLDDPPLAKQYLAKLKQKNRSVEDTLGSPIGLISSHVNFKSDNKALDLIPAHLATYYIAFARLHINPEVTWTPAILDEIMKDGLDLYTRSDEEEEVNAVSPSEIYTSYERNVIRDFQLLDCQFQVELMRKFYLTKSKQSSDRPGQAGDGNVPDLALRQIKPTLKQFFRKHKYGLLSVGSFYAMIWQTKGVYFIFDVCGRRVNDFIIDQDKGVAMLICLKTLDNVRYLFLGLSGLSPDDPCTLREMKVVRLTTPTGNVLQREFELRRHQYEIINDDYACLKASLHLSLNRAELLRNRSALPVCVAAMLASKIDHPATWNTKMLDKILCYGANFCQSCWFKCTTNDPIDIDEFPNYMNIGQFRAHIELKPRRYEGIWRCVPGYRQSDLAQTIERAFTNCDTKLLLQINFQMYAIWKQNDFIYFLDPFRHRVVGMPGQSSKIEEMERYATLRIFRSFTVFLTVLNTILLDSNRSSPFYLHTMKVRNVQLRERKDGIQTMEEDPILEADGEIKPLNEIICFEETEDVCHRLLGEISDYEDEDLYSAIFELELRTTSSEPEEVEEEEAGMTLEDLEGIESASSGDEADKDKGKGKKGKGGKKRKSKSDKPEESESAAKSKVKAQPKSGKTKKGGDEQKEPPKPTPDEKDDKDKEAPKEAEKPKDKEPEKPKEKEPEKEPEKPKEPEKEKPKEEEKPKEDEKKKIKEERDADKPKEEPVQVKTEPISPEKTEIKQEPGTEQKPAEGTAEDAVKTEETTEATAVQGSATTITAPPEQAEPAAAPAKKAAKRKITKRSARMGPLSKWDRERLEGKAAEQAEKPPEEMKQGADCKMAPTRTCPCAGKKVVPRPRKRVCKPEDGKGMDADDEADEAGAAMTKAKYEEIARQHRFPGFFDTAHDMVVVGSETGTYDSLCKLMKAGFKSADRIFMMTPWGNYVLFLYSIVDSVKPDEYYLFQGCTCSLNHFRHLDLSLGTSGLKRFSDIHDMITYIIGLKSTENDEACLRYTADEICREFCL